MDLRKLKKLIDLVQESGIGPSYNQSVTPAPSRSCGAPCAKKRTSAVEELPCSAGGTSNLHTRLQDSSGQGGGPSAKRAGWT